MFSQFSLGSSLSSFRELRETLLCQLHHEWTHAALLSQISPIHQVKLSGLSHIMASLQSAQSTSCASQNFCSYSTFHHACYAQVSAGNQLFHVVVDNDDVATRITALLTEQRAGRVTFIPLNRINPQPVQYPDFGDDALPLVNKINCAEQHTKAVAQARSPSPTQSTQAVACPAEEDSEVLSAAQAALLLHWQSAGLAGYDIDVPACSLGF